MPNVILKRQRREVGGRLYKPGDMVMLPEGLADALAMYGLCDLAKPLEPGKLKPRVDEDATKKAIARAKKIKADKLKPPKKKAPPAPVVEPPKP